MMVVHAVDLKYAHHPPRRALDKAIKAALRLSLAVMDGSIDQDPAAASGGMTRLLAMPKLAKALFK